MTASPRMITGAIVAITALILAQGSASAGGMPSDEGPEVVLDAIVSPDEAIEQDAAIDVPVFAALDETTLRDISDAMAPDASEIAALPEQIPLPPSAGPRDGFKDHR